MPKMKITVVPKPGADFNDFINCANEKITGISYDGGYAEYVSLIGKG